ncbi:MAG: pyridoxamine 5'-phosphate oxidase family protein [Treponema sp.]|nr:pyridoxamine 5'-phosphate oxidase family protein [Treponema sp.]
MIQVRNEKLRQPDAYAQAVIDKCGYFVMAVTGADGSPYCVPLSMAREGEWLYFHSAKEGHKIDNLRINSRVCVTCVGNYRVQPGRFNIEYESAVVFGTACEVLTAEEKIRALKLISWRYTPEHMEAFDASIDKSLRRTAVWKIHIDEISGKGVSEFAGQEQTCR